MAFASGINKKTKEISGQFVDCVITMYSLPGGRDADKNAMLAYKTLATDMLLLQPGKHLSRITPFRLLQICAKQQPKQ